MTQEEFHKRYEYNPKRDCLGEGGFGKVFKAYDTHLDRYVALKIAEVKENYEDVRLKKEVELINKLPTHPNIAHYEECYSFSTYTGESDYGILQYYEQGNLQQLLTDKQLSYEQKDSILKQILEGIVFLHSQGIIHRDLKPQNILIATNRKGEYIPKITDFGISKKLDINKSSVFTNSLAGAGTLSFASPEQLTGQTIRKNTDLWSFGVIACWMFTGNLPFNSGSLALTSEAGRIELFKQITSGEVTAVIQQLPADWRNLVRQCLVVDIEKRISGAGSCLGMLNRNAEVPKENFKSVKTSNTNAVTSTANTGAPHTTTNYISTQIETSEPKSKLTHIEVDATISNLGRNIFIGVAVIAMFVVSLFYFINNTDESSKQSSAIESVSSSNIDSAKLQVSSNEPVAPSNIDKSTQKQTVSNNETIITPKVTNNSTVTDIDGNVYKTVQIGNQVWIAENLRVTHYRNGDAIPNITDNIKWNDLKEGAYCDYNDNPSISKVYGKLYNGYTLLDNREIAPKGWHVASEKEWKILIKYLGGGKVAGGKLKEKGTIHWRNPNIGATNLEGFNALPGGRINGGGGSTSGMIDCGLQMYTNWICKSSEYASRFWSFSIDNDSKAIEKFWAAEGGCGMSVRCIKNN